MAFKRMILTLILFICQVLIQANSSSSSQHHQGSNWRPFSNDSGVGLHSTSSLLWSPSPEDYQNLYNVACGLGKDGSKRPLSKRELIELYANDKSERMKQVVKNWNIYQECRREPAAWRYLYIDEAGKVLINERTIDERTANIMAMIRAAKAFSIDAFTYDSGDPLKDRENMDLVAGPKFNDDLCGQQLDQMVRLAEELADWAHLVRTNSTGMIQRKLTDQHISLAKTFDSYGRHEVGRLMGKFYFSGSFHACRYNKLILDETAPVEMRYCWAHLSYERRLAEPLRTRSRSIYENPLNIIYVGICIPESCHSKSLDKHKGSMQKLIDTQFKQPLSTYVDENLDLSSLYCVVDEESDFGIPLAGKCLLGFIAGWSLLTFGVTVYNSKCGNSAKWQEQRQAAKETNAKMKKSDSISLLESLDLMESWQNFTDYYTRPALVRAVQLDTMSLFKVFGCAFVVFGHTMAVFGGYSGDEIRAARFLETDAILCMIVAGTFVVDTFFVMSGILWAYFALKALNSRKTEAGAGANSKNQPPSDETKEGNGQFEANLTSSMADQSGAIAMTIGRVDESSLSAEESSKFLRLGQKQTFELDPEPPRRNKMTIAESWPTTIKMFCARWFTMSIFRYLRIVPTYALVHWFKKYVFIYAGMGPFWDHGFNHKSTAGACLRESPLTPFTFLAAYLPISRQCTMQSWSIANDLFFALLAPPIILLINKRPRVAAWLTLLSSIISYVFAMDAIASYPSEVDEELRELRAVGFYRLFDEASLLYTAPHYRIFCFLAGVWGGYAIYHCQAKIDKRRAQQIQRRQLQQQPQQVAAVDNSAAQDQVCVEFLTQIGVSTSGEGPELDRIKWPNWFRTWATFLAVFYMLFTFTAFGFNQTFKALIFGYYRLIYPQFMTTLRVIWALANVVVFLRMMTDWKDSLLMRWSASKFWQAFSKLCLVILLIHLDILYYTLEVSPTMATNFTKWSFFILGAGIFLICIPLGLFIHVVFEMPLDRLIRSRLPKAM